MAAVWEQSRDLMSSRVATIEEAVIGLVAGDANPGARRDAEREAHKLAGSLGTFGRQAGSDLAREIERLLQGSEALDPGATLKLSQLVVGLRGDLERDAGQDRPAEVPAPAAADGPEVFIVDADADFAHRVLEQALARGMRASAVGSAGAARHAMTERQPALVLVDPALEGAGEEGLSLVAELSAAWPLVPIVVVADATGGVDRLGVSRAGGYSLVPKPVSPQALLGSASRILDRLGSDATVLVVDDDPTVSALVREVMAPRGLHVEGLADPRQVWVALDELRPDLIVLDLDLPDIDGLELCRMIRRDPAWWNLPIIFLTGIADAEWVREMFAAGADDHIAKPILPDDLVTRIGNRLARVKALRSEDDVDPRSTLASPSAFVPEVNRLLALARRHGTPLAIAVVEVDRTDELVQTHGRAAADRALAGAGRLLSRSGRPEDVAGWVTDRRIAIAMNEHDVTPAVERLARFLEAVRAEEIAATATVAAPFHVTASAGVAAFPLDGDSPATLLAAAGQALARAQDAGSDRVVGTAAPSAQRSGLMDVLVVDDDEAMGALLMHALATRGNRAEWVRDGAEAATLLVEQQALGARVVLLDVGLPGLDGLSVLRKLRDSGVLQSTRVIMLTLRSSDAEVLEALDLGAFDHVAKPFSLPVLLHRVRRALDSLPA